MTSSGPAAPILSAEALMDAVVGLADTLSDGFDVQDLLHQLAQACSSLLGAEDAAVLLFDDARLRLTASSSRRVELLEQYELAVLTRHVG